MSRGGYTAAIDMWSAGCVFGELLQRVPRMGSATTPHLQVNPRQPQKSSKYYFLGSYCRMMVVQCLFRGEYISIKGCIVEAGFWSGSESS